MSRLSLTRRKSEAKRTQRLARLLEVCVALLAMLITLPIAAMAVAASAVSCGGSGLFRQRRIGLDGNVFEILKVRTMTLTRDPSGNLLPDAKRVTRVGGFIRRTSIDELPQLWNILRGEMTFVGPRPLLPEYLPLYTPRQKLRHRVKPGMTGWAQVNGRNSLSWEDSLELDAWYVEHRSIRLDIYILLLTIGRVLGGSGVAQDGQATKERFRGSTSRE